MNITKNQDIVTLWVKSGELLKESKINFGVELLREYEILMNRLEVLCKVHHNLTLNSTIKMYIDMGWIELED